MTKAKKPVTLCQQMLEAYEQRVIAAGGHFKMLPLADDVVPSVRKARTQASSEVDAAPSIADAIQQQKRRGRG